MSSLSYSAFTALAVSVILLATGCASPTNDFHFDSASSAHSANARSEPQPRKKREPSDLADSVTAEIPSQSADLLPANQVPEAIQIIGGVKNPGAIPFQKGADLAFYLSEAGVRTTESKTTKVQIIRGMSGKKQAQEFELGNSSPPPIRSGDIVIVHPAKEGKVHFFEKPLAMAASAAAFMSAVALCILVI